MIAMASLAITNSTGFDPLLIALSFSSSFILREAFAISTVPFINAAIPVPEPPPVTEILTAGFILWYSSAQARAKFTMVSEPLFSINENVSDEGFDELAGREQLGKNMIKTDKTRKILLEILIDPIICRNNVINK